LVFYKNLDRSFFRFVTKTFDRRTDGQTDGQTPFSSLVRAAIPCSAEKVELTLLGCLDLLRALQ